MNSFAANSIFIHKPSSRLEAHSGQQLRDLIMAIKTENYALWVIDMDHVEFIDSSGLGALVAVLNLSRQYQRRLVLCNLHPSAKLIFDITQLDRAFKIYDTYEAVVRHLSEPVLAAA